MCTRRLQKVNKVLKDRGRCILYILVSKMWDKSGVHMTYRKYKYNTVAYTYPKTNYTTPDPITFMIMLLIIP